MGQKESLREGRMRKGEEVSGRRPSVAFKQPILLPTKGEKKVKMKWVK